MSKLFLILTLFLVGCSSQPISKPNNFYKTMERRMVLQCGDSGLNDTESKRYLRSEDGDKELLIQTFRCHSA